MVCKEILDGYLNICKLTSFVNEHRKLDCERWFLKKEEEFREEAVTVLSWVEANSVSG